MYFEGVCVTTVILAPGACGLGLRAALLATISAAPVAAVAPAAVFQKAPISCYLPYLSTCGPPKTSPDPSPGLRAAQEGLQEPQEGLEELIFDEISVIWVQAGYFGSGKILDGLVWPQKNLGRVISATEK